MPRLDYFAPGVYVEEIDRGSRPIEGISTAVAGFVGFTEDIRGGAEPFKPMLVTNWTQYLKYFARPNSHGFTDFDAYLPFAVYGYFMNGGGRCWITSIGAQLPSTSPGRIQPAVLQIQGRGKRPALNVSMRSEQASGGALQVVIDAGTPRAINNSSTSETETPPPAMEFFTVEVRRGDQVLERYEHLTMNAEIPEQLGSYVETALRSSLYITVEVVEQSGRLSAHRPQNGIYDVSPPTITSPPAQFSRNLEGVRDDRTGVRGLLEIDEITMLCCPDLMRAYEAQLIDLEQVHSIMMLMINTCEGSADGDIPNPPNRMVVLDTPPDRVRPQEVVEWLSQLGQRSMFAALYYPWIKVPNPRNNGKPIAVPPCGHVMGVWARTDETRGVYKAPANEVPRGVLGLAYDTNFREQELLNPVGINCIRNFPNRGIRIWGARTLVEPDRTEWRYISVRRLVSYIAKSIELGTQWAVFEPNDEDLWARVRRTVSNFLERIWREGALFGATPEQAFYVKCDAELNPPETMILGRLYIEVGICPVRPAEFVIFRISQWNGVEEEA
jgi:phage tail sheath protein FI